MGKKRNRRCRRRHRASVCHVTRVLEPEGLREITILWCPDCGAILWPGDKRWTYPEAA